MISSLQKIEENNRDISKAHFNIKSTLKLRQQNLLTIKNISTR